MKNLCHRAIATYLSSNGGHEALKSILNMQEHPGWKHLQGLLVEIGNNMSNVMFKDSFQNKPDEIKLRELSAYKKMDEFIRFVLDPVPMIRRVQDIRKHNIERSRKTAPKEKSNG